MFLFDVCLSVAYIETRNSRTERPTKTKIGTEVAHVTRDSRHHFQGQKVKDQGHQTALVGCSSHYIIHMDDTSFYATTQSEPLPVDHEYSWRKARCALQA